MKLTKPCKVCGSTEVWVVVIYAVEGELRGVHCNGCMKRGHYEKHCISTEHEETVDMWENGG
jgi:formate dehydrogenase maturation protein FdhE